MCQLNRSAVRAETRQQLFARQEPRPSVDGGNPRNLIQRALGRSVSVCSTRSGGREVAEQFEGHKKKPV